MSNDLIIYYRSSYFVLLWIMGLVYVVFGASQHKYQPQEQVPFYVNKIGPYSNPSETYEYYSLPFCPPAKKEIQHRHVSLGEVLEGDAISNSAYDIRFGVNIQWQLLCKLHLQPSEIRQFKKAIDEFYFFEFLFDDLPLRGFIGTTDQSGIVEGRIFSRHYLFKHLHFHILYNKDQVIYANVSSDLRQLQELNEDEDISVEFSYSAKWTPTHIDFSKRMELFQDDFFDQEMEIHWLSIMNSFVLVILLTGFIAIIILRVLKSDYSRYAKPTQSDEEPDPEDYGWKLIHGDVFRFPPYKNVLCAFIGVGAQFLAMTFFILLLSLLGTFYPGDGGALYTAAIFLYALTAGISGCVSSAFYKQLGGEKWAWTIVLAATLYAIPFFCVSFFVNLVAHSYSSTSAIPFPTIIIILAIWLFVGFPLTVLGGIAGKRLAGPFSAPTRTKNFPREIPAIPWYRQAPVQMAMAGFLPFSAIYIELYYVYTSVWGHNSYTLYGILFLVFLILLVVTACITIALTYFQLSMEDHRWWWRSFLSGGSTGIFIYLYSFFYYYYRSKMSGSLQASFYFGYMLILCYYFFIMLGTVGFYASLIFIKKIYSNIKCE